MDNLNPSNRVRFDQALIDATFASPTKVEGYVRSVQGVDHEVAQYLDSATKSMFGITARHRLGRIGTLHRLRLMPDGSIEKEAYQ